MRAGEDVAERYLNAFHTTVLRLASNPGLGPEQRFREPELAGIRSFRMEGSFGVHLIFYRADNEKLSIERVLHGSRDLPRRLLE
jgi:plasmid stabilization system protein ParE